MPLIAIESHTRRQIGLRLLPFLFLLYIVNFLDRSSVAYAALGMRRDLGFNDKVFGLAFGIFFVGYVLLQIPGALLVERWSARKTLSLTMIAWGAMTGLTALVHTPGQLYGARLLLGAAEASFFPGVVVYLSRWFVREDRAKATSNFMSAIPLSFVVGSPIAGWILSHSWSGIAGWRWLFVLEGIPAIVMGAVAYFYLTDRPSEARWLNADQRMWVANTLSAQKPVAQKTTLAESFRSKNVLLIAAVVLLNYCVNYSFVFWLPTMLKRITGFTDWKLGLVGAIPYLASFLAMQINGWHSDKTMERRWHAAVPTIIGAVGLFGLLWQPASVSVNIFLLTLVIIANSYLPPCWALPTEILSPSIAAASVGFISAIGSLAGFAAPYGFGYLNDRTGTSIYGLTTLAVLSVFATSAIFLLPKASPTAKHG